MELKELYRLHKEKHGNNSATYSAINNRRNRGKSDEYIINTPNQGKKGRSISDEIYNEYQQYLAKGYKYISYKLYTNYHNIYSDEYINQMRYKSKEGTMKIYKEEYLKISKNPVSAEHFRINYLKYGKEKSLLIDKKSIEF